LTESSVLASPICCCLVLVLVGVSYRHARATKQLWAIAQPFLEARTRHDVAPAQDAARARVAELNEATIEIGGGLARAGVVARACAKAALSLGALGALLDGAALLEGGLTPVAAPLLSFVGGCGGALACLWLGRTAEHEARRLRSAWGALIRHSAQDVRT
jgi:hypothetical protein